MRSLIIFIILAIIVSFMWANSGFWAYDKELYVSKKVLEHSVPFDVRINEEFLKSLEPANESSRTSPEGF